MSDLMETKPLAERDEAGDREREVRIARLTAGSSMRRGLPSASSQTATPEFVVPRSSAQPVIM